LAGLFPPRPTSLPQKVAALAQTSDALMGWDTINGKRYRWWCKICRAEGNPWLWEPTCSHVETAQEETKISKEQMWATMERFAKEIDQES
jgi:hypothetical protein